MSAPRSLPPRSAPGALVFRLYVDDDLLDERVVGDPALADEAAEAQASRSIAEIDRGAAETRVYIYDGDSGECVGTIVSDR